MAHIVKNITVIQVIYTAVFGDMGCHLPCLFAFFALCPVFKLSLLISQNTNDLLKLSGGMNMSYIVENEYGR